MSGLSRVIVLIGVAILLGACQSGGGAKGGASPQAVQAGPTPGLEARERFSLALRLLERGDARQARTELIAYKAAIPDSGPANQLLEQIDSPISDYFPAESFEVDLGTGESLSTLAKTYLGDALKFYGLARYNGISNPSRVTIGQAIRIPLTPEAIAARKSLSQEPKAASPKRQPGAKEAAPVKQAGWDEIRSDIAKGQHKNAIKKIEEIGLGKGTSAAQLELAATAYSARADALGSANGKTAADYYVKASALYVRLEKSDQALGAAEKAVQSSSGHKGARAAVKAAKQSVAENYYRMGSASFQKQELDAAIAHWDRVLKIDPGHSNAKLRRAQALELKEKLSKLNKGS